ncbi:MAG: DUF6247 family protein, partial [Pseudonocardiaceae bacterium]
ELHGHSSLPAIKVGEQDPGVSSELMIFKRRVRAPSRPARSSVFHMPAAAHLPESHRASAEDSAVGGLEPSPERVGDATAVARFGCPEAIRAALLPEQVGEFDAALTAARRTLRLDQLRHVLRMWRRMALMTEQDPDGHRRMLATAAELQRTGRLRPGSVPWSELKTELGL